jgi:hypothetical protein
MHGRRHCRHEEEHAAQAGAGQIEDRYTVDERFPLAREPEDEPAAIQASPGDDRSRRRRGRAGREVPSRQAQRKVGQGHAGLRLAPGHPGLAAYRLQPGHDRHLYRRCTPEQGPLTVAKASHAGPLFSMYDEDRNFVVKIKEKDLGPGQEVHPPRRHEFFHTPPAPRSPLAPPSHRIGAFEGAASAVKGRRGAFARIRVSKVSEDGPERGWPSATARPPRAVAAVAATGS